MTATLRRESAKLLLFLFALTLFTALPASLFAATSNETVDLDAITLIRQEGFHNSQVMNILAELSDHIGARLTGSPNAKKANEWTRDKLAEWGLANAHLESYDFGRGWSQEFTSVRMVEPDTTMLIAIPRAWTPGTNGTITGKVIRVIINDKADFEKYHGKLAGMIVLFGEARELKPHTEVEFTRYDDKKLQEIASYGIPTDRGSAAGPSARQEMLKRYFLRNEAVKFFTAEKAAAVIEPSMYDGGEVTMSGLDYKKDAPAAVPTLNMAVEHFGRIARLLDRNIPVELELNVRNKFYDNDYKSYNTIAEIPGADPKLADEVVIIGAHLDSWHGGTGATDNGTGSAAVMEAARILKALDLKPRRTIRIALWTGEEQGLLGSRAYVEEHFASRPEPTDPQQKQLPAWMRTGPQPPLQFKPEYKKVAAYFNLDNGSGKLRGIYTQENAAVAPIFEAWIAPFKDLGCTTVTMRNTGGTDHLSFDGVGIPGFQFIQDPIEYSTRTHHSNIDTYERVQRDDLMQQAVIMATFAYEAAIRDEPLPRKLIQEEPRNSAATIPATAPIGGSPTRAAGK